MIITNVQEIQDSANTDMQTAQLNGEMQSIALMAVQTDYVILAAQRDGLKIIAAQETPDSANTAMPTAQQPGSQLKYAYSPAQIIHVQENAFQERSNHKHAEIAEHKAEPASQIISGEHMEPAQGREYAHQVQHNHNHAE